MFPLSFEEILQLQGQEETYVVWKSAKEEMRPSSRAARWPSRTQSQHDIELRTNRVK